MGGGNMTRPDFGTPEPDPQHPLTEFYLALQAGLAACGSFALPGAWVRFAPPRDTKLYAEDIRSFCRFSPVEREGYRPIFPAGKLRLLYSDIPVAKNGTPLCLMLTEEITRHTVAVRLLPPVFAAMGPQPPLPTGTAALTVQLDEALFDLLDSGGGRFGRALCESPARKQWLSHPEIDKWLETALAVSQRSFDCHQNAERLGLWNDKNWHR